MNQVIFLLLVAFCLVFLYKTIDKLPNECQGLAARLTGLLPCFDGKKADLKSFAFFLSLMAFVVTIFAVIFR